MTIGNLTASILKSFFNRDGAIYAPKEPLQQLHTPKSNNPTKIIVAVGLLRKLKDGAMLSRERFFINM